MSTSTDHSEGEGTKANVHTGGFGFRQSPVLSRDDNWWRLNRSIRFYGLTFLIGTKLADVVTTAVGVKYVPTIVEANPIADHFFTELGLFTGLLVVGFATVCFAACAAELFGIEVRRRYGLPKTALFAQASIYLVLSVLFGLVAIHNTMLIADQATYMLNDVLGPTVTIGS